MVGIFSRFSGFMRPQTFTLDKKESKVAGGDGVGEADFDGDLDDKGVKVVVGLDAEFKPVEHPLEPLDEDRPVNHPMPDYSLLNDECIWKELASLQKECQPVVAANEGSRRYENTTAAES